MTGEPAAREADAQPGSHAVVDTAAADVRAGLAAAPVLPGVEGGGGLDDRRLVRGHRPDRSPQRGSQVGGGRRVTPSGASCEQGGRLPEPDSLQAAHEVEDVAARVAAEAEVPARLLVDHEARGAVLVERAEPDEAAARAPELDPCARDRVRDRVSGPDRLDVEELSHRG